MNKDLKQGSGVKSDISPADGKSKLGDVALILKEIEQTIEFYEKTQMEYIEKFNKTENKHLLKWTREQIKNTDVAINVLKSLKDNVKSRFA